MKPSVHSFYDSIKNVKGSFEALTIGVLMVGNNPMELGQCCRSLTNFRKAKFTIETAFDSGECFKCLVKFKPSIVVLDDSIGFMSMMEIAETMRSDARFAHIPLIIIKSSNYHHAALKKGVDAFVMLDRVLSGELPYTILHSIKHRKEKSNKAMEFQGTTATFDKRLSKMWMSFFSPNKAST